MKPKALAIPETEEPPSNHCPGPDEPEEPPSSTAFAKAIPRTFTGSPNSYSFRQKFFPTASDNDWHNWQWQLRHRLTNLKQLEKMLRLSEQERHSLQFNGGNGLPLAITPYYASLIDPDNPDQPLRRTMVPTTYELLVCQGEEPDPLGEDCHSPVPGLIHRYPDRVLFLVTDYCSSYCRYCTRSRMVGKRRGYSKARWQKAIAYISANPQIRDVLISGGDPLTLPDHQLEWLLSQLHAIEHVEMIRIGTKTPIVLPQRITSELVNMLKQFHPLWLSVHCTHPDELTPEAQQAFARLADAGIPLGSQTVLLAGINDSVATMKKLMHGLVKNRVKPYYLYQCDPILGSSHFRTPVSKGLEIYQGMRGHTTGYAVPNYVIDAPGGGGKIPLIPETVVGRDGNDLLLKNYEGKVYRYPDVIE
ncbi:MAG: KamA family radical SAM protein [Desulfobulbaceae bacterium]|nr:KamA family radical SAM protein [Desulfobulbaceae bacterium]